MSAYLSKNDRVNVIFLPVNAIVGHLSLEKDHIMPNVKTAIGLISVTIYLSLKQLSVNLSITTDLLFLKAQTTVDVSVLKHDLYSLYMFCCGHLGYWQRAFCDILPRCVGCFFLMCFCLCYAHQICLREKRGRCADEVYICWNVISVKGHFKAQGPVCFWDALNFYVLKE